MLISQSVLCPPHVEEHTCRAPEVTGSDYTHKHRHTHTLCGIYMTGHQLPVDFFPPCSMKNRRTLIFFSSTYSNWLRDLQKLLSANICPACLFSWSIHIVFLAFFEATQGATNEKVISDCGLYKGLGKQGSKYIEAFQGEKKKYRKGLERGERGRWTDRNKTRLGASV